jgi:hypothetical protein
MKIIEKGGVLNHNGEISNWCRTAPLSEYGAYYWVLKEEHVEAYLAEKEKDGN